MPPEPLKHPWAKHRLRHRFSFSAPFGKTVEPFIREWAGPLRLGRPPGATASHDQLWQQGLERKLVELEDKYERDRNLGLNGHRPSEWEAAISFAYDVVDDLPEHYRLPDGSLNPTFERPAADLISTAVKRLQIAQTKLGRSGGMFRRSRPGPPPASPCSRSHGDGDEHGTDRPHLWAPAPRCRRLRAHPARRFRCPPGAAGGGKLGRSAAYLPLQFRSSLRIPYRRGPLAGPFLIGAPRFELGTSSPPD